MSPASLLSSRWQHGPTTVEARQQGKQSSKLLLIMICFSKAAKDTKSLLSWFAFQGRSLQSAGCWAATGSCAQLCPRFTHQELFSNILEPFHFLSPNTILLQDPLTHPWSRSSLQTTGLIKVNFCNPKYWGRWYLESQPIKDMTSQECIQWKTDNDSQSALGFILV